jgi:hypothetical protein
MASQINRRVNAKCFSLQVFTFTLLKNQIVP